LCPACETSLTEPDDVVVCSLNPTNDYKTSVLSGLSPSLILEICSRALSFWQYQIHQENSYQHSVLKYANEKNAQLQKQLDNVIREANGELNLLNNKIHALERDVELEKRKNRDLQEASRERDKEYQKLKAQYDRMKRKALLGTNNFNQHPPPELNPPGANLQTGSLGVENMGDRTRSFTTIGGGTGNINSVVGDMEANKMQRTPLVSRVNNNAHIGIQPVSAWAPRINSTNNPNAHPHSHNHSSNNRQQFPAPRSVNPPRTNSISDGSDNGMGSHSRPSRLSTLTSHGSWPTGGTNVQTRAKPSGRFRPPAQYNAGR